MLCLVGFIYFGNRLKFLRYEVEASLGDFLGQRPAFPISWMLCSYVPVSKPLWIKNIAIASFARLSCSSFALSLAIGNYLLSFIWRSAATNNGTLGLTKLFTKSNKHHGLRFYQDATGASNAFLIVINDNFARIIICIGILLNVVNIRYLQPVGEGSIIE